MEDIQKYIIVAAVILGLAAILGSNSGSGSSRKTDGIYESAVSKLDSGQTLNARKQQRISDIINWCNRCNGPIRSCNH